MVEHIPLLFTTTSGVVLELNVEDLSLTSCVPNLSTTKDMEHLGSKAGASENAEVVVMPLPRVLITGDENGYDKDRQTPNSRDPPPLSAVHLTAASTRDQTASIFIPMVNTPMVYNDYGELIEAGKPLDVTSSNELTPMQWMRLIDRVFHSIFRTKLCEIMLRHVSGTPVCASDGTQVTMKGSSWNYMPVEPQSAPGLTPDGKFCSVPVYNGPPRILDVGCGDGDWCCWIKLAHPDWCVEGLDDSACWLIGREDAQFRDFMIPDENADGKGYYDKVHLTPGDRPEFTTRDINTMLSHPNPIPHNLYSLIRGRDAFNKVESYRTFLEDIRLILQPDGVVEFLEVDPRPRRYVNTHGGIPSKDDHISRSQTDWTDDIAGRLKETPDSELNISVPAWSARVHQRLQAALRPKDGIPAVNLKSWMEGAGFWDVKQLIFHLPVGGDSVKGQTLLGLIGDQLEMEDSVPLLANILPKVSLDEISSGEFFINIYNLTARKPKNARTGDLMMDGTRKEMTSTKYDAMARMNDAKSNQWQRFDLDSKLRAILDDSDWRTGLSYAAPPLPLPRSDTQP
ncbi:MAG: hypothetical protein M1818_007579 [Claussenomyces sp. TS43310]|nr:MAG: hypothetical protein M1818_007579 [Claussenomyces sp. TS43310]